MFRLVALSLAIVGASSCNRAHAARGDIPDFGDMSANAANASDASGDDLCRFVSLFDSIIVGRVVNTSLNTSPWVVFDGGAKSHIAPSCELPYRENRGIEVVVDVERVLVGEDPGPRVTARLGHDAATSLFPAPYNRDGALAWAGTGASRADGSLYEQPLVPGQEVGVMLTRLADPDSPVVWTMARGRFFMEKADGLHFSHIGANMPDSLNQISSLQQFVDASQPCRTGIHDGIDVDAFPLVNYAGRCYGDSPAPKEPMP